MKIPKNTNKFNFFALSTTNPSAVKTDKKNMNGHLGTVTLPKHLLFLCIVSCLTPFTIGCVYGSPKDVKSHLF